MFKNAILGPRATSAYKWRGEYKRNGIGAENARGAQQGKLAFCGMGEL